MSRGVAERKEEKPGGVRNAKRIDRRRRRGGEIKLNQQRRGNGCQRNGGSLIKRRETGKQIAASKWKIRF